MFISDKDKVRLGDYGICSALGLYKVIVTEQSTDAMHELSFEKVDVLKLARAYVALALAQDEAKRLGSQHSVQSALLPLVSCLDVTAALLEEVLHTALPEVEPADPDAVMSANLLM